MEGRRGRGGKNHSFSIGFSNHGIVLAIRINSFSIATILISLLIDLADQDFTRKS
ncbi:hypothetical protein OROHE_007551 [Orobanche hederae]